MERFIEDSPCSCGINVPHAIWSVFRQIDVLRILIEGHVRLVITPGGYDQITSLDVKRKELDVYVTCGLNYLRTS
ncbi:hypothetical protein DPMN_180944 [Dreissena polymorpha]|uniref:Uncharacterized protein n=1 Tax=Dreissena polymorpha TaxID=45954 RepID=A0A9D4I4U2_DREPO|nr:hypothetical protein DPMN_180925 [Dreissena polymorpha]KAH3746536.1 hypothetical protein DPMN_180944 [Dreissena polymorpha]